MPTGLKAWTPILLGALALAGCNKAGEEINQVQTNLVDKSIFEGEWWVNQTMIEVDSDAGNSGMFAFEGMMAWADMGVDQGNSGNMARIRWVIDEDHLFAYRAYELIEGGNDDGRDPSFRGQPIAAFPIEAHVDIRRDYDPVTGELRNVTKENTSDRRWYERQYMRVDWAYNDVRSFYFPDQELQWQRNGVQFLLEEDGSHPDFKPSWAPQFVTVAEDPDYRFADEWPEELAETVHYFSVVNIEMFSPGEACLLYGLPCQTWQVPLRLSFLRVPPEHDYVASTHSHREFDRFGIIRSEQRTYVRGGQDQASLRERCDSNEDCGPGGACDVSRHVCVGGLTEDYGETDFLTFYRSRHNFFRNSLTDVECRADWECNGTYGDPDAEGPLGAGSECDRSARRCTVPLAQREVRPVTYHLDAGHPAYLVPTAYQVMGDWNEVFMRGWRAAQGRALPNYEDFRIDCQNEDPTQYCYCGNPEVQEGTCRAKYDPFVSPAEWEAIGVTDPYQCHVQRPEGWTEPANPTSFEDYTIPTVYQHEFVGEECMLTLESNTCDKFRTDPSQSCDEVTDAEGNAVAWEQLGDLRYQFFHYIDHAGAFFCGVSMPLIDPTNGELIVSNANMAGDCTERMSWMALEYFPVLRGEVSEEYIMQGEDTRGYFSRLGRTEHPVAMAASGTDGYSIDDGSRPAVPANLTEFLQEHVETRMDKIESLRGREGRLNVMSDRLRRLAGTPLEDRIMSSMGPDGRDLLEATTDTRKLPRDAAATDASLIEDVSPFRNGGLLEQLMEKRRRETKLYGMFIDPPFEELFENRYYQYFADRFEGRPRAEASIRMQQALTRAVMWHEMGHSVGLEHNFGASLDRNHYYDSYFDAVLGDAEERSDDLDLPRIDDFDNPNRGGDADGFVEGEEVQRYLSELRRVRNERANRGASTTMSTSVMDYHGDLSDMVYGLGRYDVAATVFSYFDQVEGYTEDPRLRMGTSLDGLHNSRDVKRDWLTYYRGGQSCSVPTGVDDGEARRLALENSACPYARGSSMSGGQPVTQRCIKNPRTTTLPELCGPGDSHCICSSFDADFEDFEAGVTGYNNDRDGDGRIDLLPTNYLFCENSRVNDISWCNMFDAGESFQEVIDHYRRRWEESYPLNYYRRFRRGGAGGLGSLGYIIDASKIYQHLFFRLFYEPGFFSNTGPLGFQDQFLASVDSMNWFIELVNLPNAGSYDCNQDTGVCRYMGEYMDMPGADFSLPVGLGFPMWSKYQEGHQGWFRQERSGVFMDKYVALLALALRDWGFSYTIDERFYINFYDLFGVEMTEFFGGVIQQDPTWFAPRVRMAEEGPQVSHLNWYRGTTLGECENAAGDRVPCRGSQREVFPVGELPGGGQQYAIEGTSNEILRDWAAMLALAEFPVFYDTSFEQRLSVYKLDNGDGFNMPELTEDGDSPCAYGDIAVEASHRTDCTKEEADYVVYESDRFHTPYVAVKIRPRIEYNLEEEQLGFQLLSRLYEIKERIADLESVSAPSAEQLDELSRLRSRQQQDESFLELLIEVQRQYGISSYF